MAVQEVSRVRGRSRLVGCGVLPQSISTRRYVDALELAPRDRAKVFETNALRVYPRVAARLQPRPVG
jgi:hypothetical protein